MSNYICMVFKRIAMRLSKGIEIEDGSDGFILGGDFIEESEEYDVLAPLSEEAVFLLKNIGERDFDEDYLAQMLCDEFGMDYTRALDEALSLMNHWQDIGIIEW